MSAPNIKELDWAISELEGQESSENRYMLLAALYTCRSHLMGDSQPEPRIVDYSEASAPEVVPLDQYGDSDFLRATAGKDPAVVWPIMDELMDTLQVINGRLYESVMWKLEKL